ncbi:hypothetical protein PVAG01_01802 [Phlyctema vagabunda]|uniref:Uncharacterized protein n=1 Tax=Phlyctema vagabunda TaxID=108571 RepID=A0ABR4PY49_9HELO
MPSKRRGGMLVQPAKKSRKRAEPRDETGNLIGSETSQAARKRRRPGMSMVECGYDDPDGKVEDYDHTPTFEKNSIIHYTWGRTESQPITAPRKKRRTGSLLMLPGMGLGRGRDPRMGGMFGEPEEVTIPNGPERSHLLRVSLEIREMIYGYLLIHPRPIILDATWSRAESRNVLDHSIIRTCKQISVEASAFLFRNNCWVSLIRQVHGMRTFERLIHANNIPLIKNAVIKCTSDRGGWASYTDMCSSVQKLINAGVRLRCLTLVVEPRKLLLSTTLDGLVTSSSIRYADFFLTKQRFMSLLPRVNCQVFNVIMYRPDGTRLLISIDMRALALIEHGKNKNKNKDNGGEKKRNQDSAKRVNKKIDLVRQELKGLKELFEDVFIHGVDGAEPGKCRLLDEDESITDGLALTRGFRHM